MSVMEFRKQEPDSAAISGGAMDRVVVRKKLDKELRHYMLLELDGSIECVDLVDRMLGTKVTLGSVDAEKRRIEDEEKAANRAAEIKAQRQRNTEKDLYRLAAVVIPPIPAALTPGANAASAASRSTLR